MRAHTQFGVRVPCAVNEAFSEGNESQDDGRLFTTACVKCLRQCERPNTCQARAPVKRHASPTLQVCPHPRLGHRAQAGAAAPTPRTRPPSPPQLAPGEMCRRGHSTSRCRGGGLRGHRDPGANGLAEPGNRHNSHSARPEHPAASGVVWHALFCGNINKGTRGSRYRLRSSV